VATGDNVYALTYPAGKPVLALGVPGYGLCADAHGDVYVPQTATTQILVFAHGAITPTRTLHDMDQPLGCAVDPKTGDLAVTNAASGAGNVAVYPAAQDQPQYYFDTSITQFGQCGYDDRGDLFVDGSGSGNVLAELPAGGNAFANFSLDGRFVAYGSVQWDGTHITLSNPATHVIYRVRPEGGVAKVVGSTRLHAWTTNYNGGWPYIQTWVQGGTALAQVSALGDIGRWRYPEGRVERVIGPVGNGNATIYGITISRAR
jgi:DNA-binding beta-propeller fold protein YncE